MRKWRYCVVNDVSRPHTVGHDQNSNAIPLTACGAGPKLSCLWWKGYFEVLPVQKQMGFSSLGGFFPLMDTWVPSDCAGREEMIPHRAMALTSSPCRPVSQGPLMHDRWEAHGWLLFMFELCGRWVSREHLQSKGLTKAPVNSCSSPSMRLWELSLSPLHPSLLTKTDTCPSHTGMKIQKAVWEFDELKLPFPHLSQSLL